jgi:hypothetical protein
VESDRRAKSVIMIFNCGAPSHLDLWDMKPNAPENVRGPFRPISANVPGVQISELLPELAKRTDRLAMVRTVHHQHGGHNSGMYWSIVGSSAMTRATCRPAGTASAVYDHTVPSVPGRLDIAPLHRVHVDVFNLLPHRLVATNLFRLAPLLPYLMLALSLVTQFCGSCRKSGRWI